MPDQALVPVWTKEPRGMSDMRRLAKRVVDSTPRVQAAVLYGSRARKSARRDSDWDVALLTPERYRKEVLRTVPEIPDVNYVLLSPKQLREQHNHLGTLERNVVRDGVLLAGEWTVPKSQAKPKVSYEKLAIGLRIAADHINLAVYHLGNVIGRQPEYGNNLLGGKSQYASKHLAFAALLHLEIDHPHSNKMLDLAEALRNEHPNHAWGDAIELLNGPFRGSLFEDISSVIAEDLDKSQVRGAM